ncbi:MAG: hypothetical protein J7K40_03780 [candidate division Zixibacteria bacterium]|nr:hypothetical protein [candidate division Zixibacteria bacterium]
MLIRIFTSIVLTAVIFTLNISAIAGSVADSKMKNGKILIKKALPAEGDKKANYIYKAKREFERASSAEPDNHLPYYWQAVITFYLEDDSTKSAKLYNKALNRGAEDYPEPWLYKTDNHLLSAFKGDFSWVKEAEELPVVEEIAEVIPVEKPANPAAILEGLIASNNIVSAESLYNELIVLPEHKSNTELMYQGLMLNLYQGQTRQASDLLEQIREMTGKKSKVYKKAAALYDTVLDSVIISTKQLERDGESTKALAVLSKWQPNRLVPKSPARARLMIRYSSILFANNNFTAVESMLQLYKENGYKKTKPYKKLKKDLEEASEQQAKDLEVVELVETKTKELPEGTVNYITLSPPGGDIVKVVVDKINPTTGKVLESEMWETYSPKKLSTGAAYKLTVHKKRERKAPKYIAVVGIITTLLIMR